MEKDWIEPKDAYVYVGQQKLRRGYTTGSCAAAAAQAAARALFGEEHPQSVQLAVPKGLTLSIPVHSLQTGERWAKGSVCKDSGGPGIAVCGGVGVGRITKPGLQMPVGEAAINLVPRRMIREQIEQVRQSYPQWESVGLRALVEIPQGVQLAAKTYNPRLGIEGGISVLGTSGIVEPMSEQALTDSIRLELSILQKQGHRCVLITPGNYGKAFLSGETIGGKSDFHALAQMADRAVKCSNFVGDTLDMCVQQGFSHALLVGHIGKFSKLAAGVMNTHSRYADARLEVFTAHAALAGADRLTSQQLMSSVTTDEAIACLDKAGIRQPVLRSILQKIQDHVQARAGETMKTGVILFSNVYGYLGETDGCREILQQVLQEYEQERNDDDGR